MKDINHAELESFQTCRDTITSSMGKYKHASGVNQPYEAVIPWKPNASHDGGANSMYVNISRL